MIEIRQPSFADLLLVAGHLREVDKNELLITRDLSRPAKLATDAWCTRYCRMAYWDGVPVFAFGMAVVSPGHGQAWGFGTADAPMAFRVVTKFIKQTMIPEMLREGLAAVQALGHPENRASARWLGHLGFRTVANLAGIGAGGQDLVLWVTTADEHRVKHPSLAA